MTTALASTLEHYRSLMQQHGTLAALQHLGFRLVRKLVYYENFEIIELRKDELRPFRAQPGIRLSSRAATADDLAQMVAEGGWAITPTHLENFKSGDTCLLSFVNDELAGYTWLHVDGHPELIPGLSVSIPGRSLYNYAGFTHPKFRGYGLQAYRHHAVFEQRQWQYAESLIGYVRRVNFASRKGQNKSGYRRIGTLRLIGSERRFYALLTKALRSRGIRRLSMAKTRPEKA